MYLEKNKSIALFVGAGSVINAWNPIIRALQPDHFTDVLSMEGATSGLARLVYLMRWFSLNPGDALETTTQIMKLTKNRICEELKAAQEKNELLAREEFHNIIDIVASSECTRFLLVSTNWDTIIEDTINSSKKLKVFGKKINAAHIHGEYTDSRNLYLPSEIVEEPYRTREEREYLGKMHSSVMQSLFDAKIMIIYGLSISPLDAELSQIIGSALNSPKLKSVKIIDPNHKGVAERINLLVQYPNTKIIVEGLNPLNLTSSVDYSLK